MDLPHDGRASYFAEVPCFLGPHRWSLPAYASVGSICLHLVFYGWCSMLSPQPQKKKYWNESQNVFWTKTSTCRDGTLKKNTTKQNRNDTTILSCYPYILCHFANYAHHKTLYMQISIFTPTKWMHNHTSTSTQHCSLHSLLHTQPPISTKFSSNKSPQRNPHPIMQYRSSTAYTLHSFCI